MAVNGVEIKVGQKWFTRGGDVAEITSIGGDILYCVGGVCNGVLRSWTEDGIHTIEDPTNDLKLEYMFSDSENENKTKHSHYFKDVSHLTHIDVYRVLDLFNVTDPCLQHAVKKLLCAGGRGAKDFEKDIREAGDSIARKLQMISEDMNKTEG